MATITKNKTWAFGEILASSDLNNTFDTIYNDYNGNISNANVAANADIAGSKLLDFAILARKLDLKSAEVTDSTTRSTTSNSLVDLSGGSITVASASIPTDTIALIIATGHGRTSATGTICQVFLSVSGSTIAQSAGITSPTSSTDNSFAIVDIATLSSGANRIIKLQFASSNGVDTATILNSALAVILISKG
jgi:hypothetical protein